MDTWGQVPLSMGFSRQEDWSELPCPPPGDLPKPGVEPKSPTLQLDSLSSELPGKPKVLPKVLPPVFSNNHVPCVLFIYLQFVSLHALYSRQTSENQAGVPAGAMGCGTVRSLGVYRVSLASALLFGHSWVPVTLHPSRLRSLWICSSSGHDGVLIIHVQGARWRLRLGGLNLARNDSEGW